MSVCACVEYTPVWTPGDGGDKANVREKDGVIFDAIEGIVHLTERQSVQLELELHLKQKKHPRAYKEVGPKKPRPNPFKITSEIQI